MIYSSLSSALSAKDHLLASAQAGAMTQLLTNPIWMVKTRMCASTPTTDPNAFKGLLGKIKKVD